MLRRSFATCRPLLFPSGSKIDRSKVPKLKNEDVEEKFIKGWGPGGQNVNKTTNAVFLRHLPTGVWIKCHESRSLERNRKIARTMLIDKLDEKLNGEDSVANQEARIGSLRRSQKKEKTRLKYEKIREEKAGLGAGDDSVDTLDDQEGANNTADTLDDQRVANNTVDTLDDQDGAKDVVKDGTDDNNQGGANNDVKTSIEDNNEADKVKDELGGKLKS